MTDAYIVKPVHKALQVLLFLAQAKRPLTLTEICTQLRMPKTTVFRYLQTLHANGFVAIDADCDQYRLGIRLWELGQLAGANLPVRELAQPLMTELRDRFNETVNLGMLDHKEVVYLEMAESRLSLRTQAQTGARDPVYCTGLGKAILAFLPETQWAHHLPARLKPRTTNTLTSLAALRQDLHATRERGYALDRGENEDGAYCIAAPIFDQRGDPQAALSLSAPANRLSKQQFQVVAVALIEATTTISRRLGYVPPS